MLNFQTCLNENGKYDVIVCGAGPGGIGAAVTLGRLGKKVLLVEAAGCVGGNATATMMGILLDMPGKGGIPLEIATRLFEMNKAQWQALYETNDSYTYDIESMKYVLEDMVVSSNVDLLLFSRVTDVLLEGRRIKAIRVEGNESLCFTADWFIDGTGDGQLAFKAGCHFTMGSEEDASQMQPSSLLSLATGVPENLWKSDIHNSAVKRQFRILLEAAGHEPSYHSPLLFKLHEDTSIYAYQINHEYGVRCDKGFDIAHATVDARRELYESCEALRRTPGWENLRIVTTGNNLGIRDGRRIDGYFKLTAEDGINGSKYEDGVVPCSFCFDIHAINEEVGKKSFSSMSKRLKPYQLPMRSLESKDVDNLFMVGRCICGDFRIHSSYRVMGPAFATGEAVGIGIAQLDSCQCNYNVDGRMVAESMKDRGYVL